MTYIVKQDLIDRFGQDEMPELPGGGDDDVKIQAAIDDAEAMLNGALRSGGYDAPVTSTTAIKELKIHVARIARYLMNEDSSSISEEIETRYKETVGWLQEMRAGKLFISCPSTKTNFVGSVPLRRT